MPRKPAPQAQASIPKADARHPRGRTCTSCSTSTGLLLRMPARLSSNARSTNVLTPVKLLSFWPTRLCATLSHTWGHEHSARGAFREGPCGAGVGPPLRGAILLAAGRQGPDAAAWEGCGRSRAAVTGAAPAPRSPLPRCAP